MDHLSPVALIACVSAVLISSGFVQLCFGQQGNFNLTSINSTSAVQSMRAMCAGNGSNVFERNCIVPDLIDVSPPDILEVLYPTGITVMYGNEMTAHMVQNPPALVAWKADPCKFYTLSKSDLDTPSRANPTRSPLKHWLVINIPGRNVDKGDILGTYFGANPADGTGEGLSEEPFSSVSTAGKHCSSCIFQVLIVTCSWLFFKTARSTLPILSFSP
ncbi:hypothetical protein RvY_15260-2 [Ramazzottius varieornatus]|uniref:Uncharacterized protein n=1 Tax=Ramazzottius varieornatus TaxID=947166 RepID=A0A1D1VZ08_RAMVA|nr:hypothetical protein RvY_15260-2 [Ramazzottius varieornatus]